MMTYRRIVVLAASALLPLGSAKAADLAGKWKAEFDTQIGLQKYVYEFKVDGDKVTGKATFERTDDKGQVDLTEIKIVGDDLSFTEPLKFQDQTLRITYVGKIAGDELKLTRNVGDVATEPLVAKRVTEPAAKPAPPPATPAPAK